MLLKNILIGRFMKVGASSLLSASIVFGMNYFFSKVGINIKIHPIISSLFTIFFIFTFDFIVKNIFIPIILFSGYCLAGVTGLIYFAKKYKQDWFLSSPAAQWAALGLLIMIPIGLYLYFNFKNKFISKSLSEIDNLGNGDPKRGGFLFEEFVANMYRALGYEAKTVADLKKEGKFKTKGFDQGGDVIVDFTENGKLMRAVVQCKLYKNPVSNKAVQEVLASLPIYQANVAIVITNNYFTAAAVELAKANNVYLVNRDNLAVLIERASSPDLQNISRKIAAA